VRVSGFVLQTPELSGVPASPSRVTIAVGLRANLFISDVGEELGAAWDAGMMTAHSMRPEVRELANRGHAEIRSFDEIVPS
jgi:methionine salvage enolase-phosphatase E1